MAKILDNITLENYRGHKATSVSNINDLLMLVGKNDIGKSSVLEALDVIFNGGVIKDADYCMSNNATELSIKCTINGKNYKLKSDKNTTQQSYSRDGSVFPDRNAFDNDLRTIHYTLFRADNTKASRYSNQIVDNFIQKTKKSNTYKKYFKDQYLDADINALIKNTLEVADSFRKLEEFFQENDMQEYYNDINEYKLFTILKSDKKSILAKLRNFHFSDSKIENEKEIIFQKLFKTNLIYNLESFAPSLRVSRESEYINQFTYWFFITNLNEITPSLIDWDIVQKYEQEQNLKRKPFDDIESILEPFKNNLSPIEKRGSGVKRLCAFYQFAITAKTSFSSEYDKYILAVEEPEISLHPKQQRQFIQQLLAISKNDDIQVIATTHSPYIVNELEAENVCILKQITQTDAHGNLIDLVSTSAMSKRIIKYPSMAEVNYLAFDEPSITYHQELFCHLEIEWSGNSNGGEIKNILTTLKKITSFKNSIDALLPPNTITSPSFNPSDTASDRYLQLLDNKFYREDQTNPVEGYCICRCVRDSIDHTSTKNFKWKDNKIVELSLKILVVVAEYFEKAKEELKKFSDSEVSNLDTDGNKEYTIDGVSNNHTMKYCCWYLVNHPNAVIKKNSNVHKIRMSSIFGTVKNSL